MSNTSDFQIPAVENIRGRASSPPPAEAAGNEVRAGGNGALHQSAVHRILFPRPRASSIVRSHLDQIGRMLNDSGHVTIAPASTNQLGLGASALAAEFAWRNSNVYDRIFWVNGRVPAGLAGEFADIAYALRLDACSTGNQHAMAEAVTQCLARESNWLLVFDNLADSSMVQELLPQMHTGHVVITAAHCENTAGHLLLKPYRPEQAAAYLTANQYQNAARHAAELCNLVGGHPLALSIAASHLALIDMPVQELAQAPAMTAGRNEDNPVAPLLHTFLPHLTSKYPTALELLGLCAHFGPEPIPAHIFRDARPCVSRRLGQLFTDSGAWSGALDWLHTLHLITADKERFCVHPLVSARIRAALAPDHRQYLASAALRIVSRAFPIEETYDHPLPLCTRLLPHVLASLHYAESLSLPLEDIGRMYNQVGQYLRSCEEMDTARNCYEKAVAEARRMRGAKHPALALRLNNLAVIHQESGDTELARSRFEEALTVSKNRYGRTHPILLAQARNLGNFLEDVTDWPAARALYEDIVLRYAEGYGWNDAVTVEFILRLGHACRVEGGLERARECFEHAAKAARLTDSAALKSIMPQILIDFSALLLQCGERDEAEELVRESWDLHEAARSEDVPMLVQALSRLGDAYKALNSWGDALRCYERAARLADGSDRIGPGARSVLANRAGRAAWHGEANDQAEQWLRESLKLIVEEGGERTDAAANALVTLGRLFEDLGRFKEALNFFEEASQILESIHGNRHVSLGAVNRRKGRALEGLERPGEALVHYQRALTIHTATEGANHISVGRDAENVGNVLAKLGDTAAAYGYFNQALEIFEEALGSAHARTDQVRYKLEGLSQG